MKGSSFPGSLGKKTALPPDYEQVTIVLGVDLAVGSDRQRRVGGAHRAVKKEVLAQGPVGTDDVKVAVLAVVVDVAEAVDRRGVDAELEADRVVVDAGDVAAGVAGAAQRIQVLPARLDVQVLVEPGDEVALGEGRVV